MNSAVFAPSFSSTALTTPLQAADYIRASKADNTQRAYRTDWRQFAVWCAAQGVCTLPASVDTVCRYLAERARFDKYSTLSRRVASISQAHQADGQPSPTLALAVRATLKGIRRKTPSTTTQKMPVLVDDLRRMVDTLDGSLMGKRDRALLLVGFAGAFRRSELVSLDVSAVTFDTNGITVLLRTSKTDQEGNGRKIGIPYGSNLRTCPVRALQDWLCAVGNTKGALFVGINRHGTPQGRLSDKSVALIVKKLAATTGMNPDDYAGHSLRAGLATAAAMAGISERSIMAQTGHKSVLMVRRYIRDGSLFRENAAAGIGL